MASHLPVNAESTLPREAAVALGRHRAVSGLPAVDADLEDGAQAHASYLARNVGRPEVSGLRVHEEDLSLPGATTEGAAAAKRSHVASGDQSAASMIDGLIGAPLHRHALMDPRLIRIGLGRAGAGTPSEPFQWVVDLASADRPWVGPPVAIAYPGPGQMHLPTRFADGETPDPRATVAGAAISNMGYPVTLSFFGCRPRDTSARLTAIGPVSPDGTVATTGDTEVATYVLTPGTIIRTDTGDREVEPVLFFAKEVLRPQTAYRATVVTTCGSLGTNTYEWTFSTRPRLRASDVTVAVSAPGPDGSQHVTLVADVGGGTQPPRVSEVQASFTTQGLRTGSGPAVGGAPEIELGGRADADGRMRFRVNLRGANSAEVTAIVTDETVSIPVTFTVRPSASGVVKTEASAISPPLCAGEAFERHPSCAGDTYPSAAPFQRLLNARPSWVTTLDGG